MSGNIRKLTMCAVMAATALVLFVIEMQIPPLTVIPGIKLGLANVVTVFAIFAVGRSRAFGILTVRIILGSIICGTTVTLLYSMTGGVLSFLLCAVICRFFTYKQMWVVSIFGAMMHNVGQIAAAVLITQTVEILIYLPVLLLSGIITGAFTGICAQCVFNRLKSVGIL